MKSRSGVFFNDLPTSPSPAAWTAAVTTVVIPGLQTGSAALKHLQSVSNFSSQANCCAEQNLSWHIHSENLTATMIRILNFKKKGIKIYSLRAAGSSFKSATDIPLTPF